MTRPPKDLSDQEKSGLNISDFDLDALFAALDSERATRSMSWSGLTREVNALFGDVRCPPIATSTIAGLKGKIEVIGNAALQMLVWLDRTPESFIPGSSESAQLPRLKPDRILRFDTPAISRALDAKRIERQLTWREVAAEIGGVTAEQLQRFRKGSGIGLRRAARIAQWLERPIATFTVSSQL